MLDALDPEVQRGVIVGAVLLGSAAVFNAVKYLANRAEAREKAGVGRTEGGGQKAETGPLPELRLEQVQKLEWRRFEEMVEGYFRALGYKPQRVTVGPDWTAYLHLYRNGGHRPAAYARCHTRGGAAGEADAVGQSAMRDFLATVEADGVPEAHFIAAGSFSIGAAALVVNRPSSMHLMTGPEFVTEFNRLPPQERSGLIEAAFRDEFAIPTCPKCGIKMVLREPLDPAVDKEKMWGCRNFPKCHQELPA